MGYDRIISNSKTILTKVFFHWRIIDIFNTSLFKFEGEKQGDQKYLVMDPQLTLALEIQNKTHFQDLIPELYLLFPYQH